MPLLTRIAAAAVAVVCLTCAEASAGAADGRARRIVEALRALEASAGDARAYAETHERFYPGLYGSADSLPQGDARTDLSAAVALHDAAARAGLTSAPPDCAAELRHAYQRICRGPEGATRASLLRAKARLHVAWAEASVAYAAGRRDAETLRALDEVRAARADDLTFARRAVELLQALDAEVNAYDSLADYEQGRVLSRVAPERLEADFAETLRALDRLLAALPRGGQLYTPLRNARNSYRDGLHWHRRTATRAALTVAADAPASSFAPDPLEAMRLDPASAGYTVAVNWRNARRYTTEARELLVHEDARK